MTSGGASHYDAVHATVLGWIMNQARSRAIDRLRFESRKKRSRDDDMQPPADAAADPRDVLELREQGERLRAALAALTPAERQAIETTFFAGLTHAEAAARLDQPLGTISWSPSTTITCRSTDRPRSSPARASTWRPRHYLVGSGQRRRRRNR